MAVLDEKRDFFRTLGGGKLAKDNLFTGFFLNPIAFMNYKRATKIGIPSNPKGEGGIKGGLYIVRKGRGGVAYHFTERNFGNWASLDEIIKCVTSSRCLTPVAERIYASFSLLLTEAPVKEPTEPKLGVVLGEDVNIWRAEDEDVEAQLDIDLDDKLHFPRDNKELDLSKYLRDTIHLEIPAKSLCDSACPGFCFGCGVNLNNTPCRCGKKRTQNAVNMEELIGMDRKKNIWGPLEQLKKQLEEQQQDQSDDPK